MCTLDSLIQLFVGINLISADFQAIWISHTHTLLSFPLTLLFTRYGTINLWIVRDFSSLPSSSSSSFTCDKKMEKFKLLWTIKKLQQQHIPEIKSKNSLHTNTFICNRSNNKTYTKFTSTTVFQVSIFACLKLDLLKFFRQTNTCSFTSFYLSFAYYRVQHKRYTEEFFEPYEWTKRSWAERNGTDSTVRCCVLLLITVLLYRIHSCFCFLLMKRIHWN